MIRELKNKFLPLISNDIGVDLGTANTLVYLRGKGIVVTEPSVVAVNTKTGQVVAVGTAARDMLGRTPAHLVAVKPLIDGVVSDFEATEEMLAYLMNRAQHLQKKMLGPRVVIGVPSGVTNVEMRAVKDAAQNAGAREVHIVEEPIAAALGIRHLAGNLMEIVRDALVSFSANCWAAAPLVMPVCEIPDWPEALGRGGNWAQPAQQMDAGLRYFHFGALPAAQSGFRCVRQVP